jgi:hypothetical protein
MINIPICGNTLTLQDAKLNDAKYSSTWYNGTNYKIYSILKNLEQ